MVGGDAVALTVLGIPSLALGHLAEGPVGSNLSLAIPLDHKSNLGRSSMTLVCVLCSELRWPALCCFFERT
jgi:hypothetical protein